MYQVQQVTEVTGLSTLGTIVLVILSVTGVAVYVIALACYLEKNSWKIKAFFRDLKPKRKPKPVKSITIPAGELKLGTRFQILDIYGNVQQEVKITEFNIDSNGLKYVRGRRPSGDYYHIDRAELFRSIINIVEEPKRLPWL